MVINRWISGKRNLETSKSKESTSVWTLLFLIKRRLSCMCLVVNTQNCMVFYVIEKSQASSPQGDSIIQKKRSLHLSGIICSSRTACVDFHANIFSGEKLDWNCPCSLNFCYNIRDLPEKKHERMDRVAQEQIEWKQEWVTQMDADLQTRTC